MHKRAGTMTSSQRNKILAWRSKKDRARAGLDLLVNDVVCRDCMEPIENNTPYVRNGQGKGAGHSHYYHEPCAERLKII